MLMVLLEAFVYDPTHVSYEDEDNSFPILQTNPMLDSAAVAVSLTVHTSDSPRRLPSWLKALRHATTAAAKTF